MTASTGQLRKRRDTRIRLDEVAGLLRAGESPEQIAAVLDVQPLSIQRVAHWSPESPDRDLVLAKFRGGFGRHWKPKPRRTS